jgi:hypothetical protein
MIARRKELKSFASRENATGVAGRDSDFGEAETRAGVHNQRVTLLDVMRTAAGQPRLLARRP